MSRIRSQSEFVLFDPWYKANHKQDTCNDSRPQSDVQDIRVEACLSRKANCHHGEDDDQISRSPMILVDRLSVVHRAEDVGCVELKDTNDELDEEQDVH